MTYKENIINTSDPFPFSILTFFTSTDTRENNNFLFLALVPVDCANFDALEDAGTESVG